MMEMHDRISSQIAVFFAEFIKVDVANYRKLCQNEIEIAFLCGLRAAWVAILGVNVIVTTEGACDGWSITPQFKLDGMRIDFALNYRNGGKKISIAIECDGHNFHERTKQQAERDRSRDRTLQMHFDYVLRFTGSEIYRDMLDVSGQVLSIVENHMKSKFGVAFANECAPTPIGRRLRRFAPVEEGVNR